jgi:hypothetical protein
MGSMAAPATPDQRRPSTAPYLWGAAAGVAAHWLIAVVLWFAARAVAWRQCVADAYGLAVEGGGVTATEAGCTVDVPTSQGLLEVVLPTLDSGFALAAVLVGALSALWPLVLLVAYSRKVR